MQKLTFFLVTAISAIALYFGLSSYSAITTENADSAAVTELAYTGVSNGINTVLFNLEGSIHYTAF